MTQSRIERFFATTGTVTGAEHERLGKNNQDGLGIGATPEAIAVVVTDGCSGGRYSEVGARLGAEWLAAWAPLEWTLAREDPRVFADALTEGLEGLVRRTAARFGFRAYESIVADYFLFTFLVGVVGKTRAAIVGIGDGVFAVDGTVVSIDPGPDNAPPYVAYRTLTANPIDVRAKVHWTGDPDRLDAMFVATDGAAQLALTQFADDPKYRKNPSLLHKRLQVVRRTTRLFDDTTISAIFRRREEVLRCA